MATKVDQEQTAPNVKVRMDADGAPHSYAHMWMKSTKNELVRVKRIEDGETCLINKKDFDPDLHEKVRTKKEASETASKKKTTKKRPSRKRVTEDEDEDEE